MRAWASRHPPGRSTGVRKNNRFEPFEMWSFRVGQIGIYPQKGTKSANNHARVASFHPDQNLAQLNLLFVEAAMNLRSSIFSLSLVLCVVGLAITFTSTQTTSAA